MSESEVRAFVTATTGGRITRFERSAMGSSRATWLVDVEDGSDVARLVARRDTGDGPMSGTELSLAREAVVYAALAETPVRIPRLVAASEDGRTLLVERAPGSEAFAQIEGDEERQAVVRDFFSALAELHVVDAAKLRLPGFPKTSDAREATRADLALWQRIFRARVASDPLLALGYAWLDANAPTCDAPATLCHGDAGAGNFLFADGRVTALLDWEFAHPGDAREDLAWVAVRGQLLGGFGDLADGFAVWERATGRTAERDALETYRAMVLLRMATSCLVALGHAGERAMDTGVYEMLLPYLRFLLPDALQRAGCDSAECRDLGDEGEAAVRAHPVLGGLARPLDEWPA